MTETPTIKSTTRLAAVTGLVCSLLLSVAACGQRGPLYLPVKNADSVNAEQAASEEEKADNDDNTKENGSENEETP